MQDDVPTTRAASWWNEWGPMTRSVALAVPIGLGAGVLALAFVVVVDAGTKALWPEVELDAFSGKWYWVLILAAAGLVVGWMRKILAVPEHITGAIEAIAEADVDHRLVPKTVAISVVSLIGGASLGPTFGLVMLGGGLAAFLAERIGAEGDDRSGLILTGESGGLGGALTSPLLAAILSIEIGPQRPRGFDNRAVPAVLAAALSFAVVIPVLGRVFLDVYNLPSYEFRILDALVGLGLGVLGAIVAIVAGLTIRAAGKLGAKLADRPILRATGGGVVLGLLGFALPFTMFAGSTQLAVLIEDGADVSSWLVAATVLGKIVALAVSLGAGFIGGNVFPMVFIGGGSGVLLHLLAPSIPYSLAVTGMMGAVPGAAVRAPIGLTLFVALSAGLVPGNAVPVIVAVVTSHAIVTLVRRRQEQRVAAAG